MTWYGGNPFEAARISLEKARKNRIDKLVMEKVMSEAKFEDMIVGTTVNTIDFRGIQTITGSSKVIDPPKEAMRFDDNKLRWDLVPTEGMVELVRVYTTGALKYKDNNWRNGMAYSRCVGSLERHWNLWKSGQSIDTDTGNHHLAQVCWNAMTLLVYCLTKTGTDDRIKYNIDEKFNIVDNHLGIGLDDNQLTELKNKYKAQREKA